MALKEGQTKNPADWDELYPGRFIKPGELKGKKVLVTCDGTIVQVLQGKDGLKWTAIMSVVGTEKQLTLNKTNGICLRAMFGKSLAGWKGKRFWIFKSKWGSDDCIRVWGSPDISKEMRVKVELPRKKPFVMVMHTTADATNAAADDNTDDLLDEDTAPEHGDDAGDIAAREPGDE